MARSVADVAGVNFFIFLFSVPILASGKWLHTRFYDNCVVFLDSPFIAVGTLLMAVSFVGIIAACNKFVPLLRANMAALFFLIGLAFGFTVFAFTATSGSSVEVVGGMGYEDFKLLDGDNWLQKWAKDESNWIKTRGRLMDRNPCRYLLESNETFPQFADEDMDPIQSGCCKPPYECGYLYQSPTIWGRPPTGLLSNNSDCTTWSNNETTLCYDCQSCKASIVAKVKKDRRKAATINIVFLCFVFIIYPYGCRIFKHQEY